MCPGSLPSDGKARSALRVTGLASSCGIPQVQCLDPEVSVGPIPPASGHMPRLQPRAFVVGKEIMCSAGFWAALSPTCQPEKKQTLGRLTCRGWAESFAAPARRGVENPLAGELSHRAL